MAYKLIDAAQARWRAVNAPHLVAGQNGTRTATSCGKVSAGRTSAPGEPDGVAVQPGRWRRPGTVGGHCGTTQSPRCPHGSGSYRLSGVGLHGGPTWRHRVVLCPPSKSADTKILVAHASHGEGSPYDTRASGIVFAPPRNGVKLPVQRYLPNQTVHQAESRCCRYLKRHNRVRPCEVATQCTSRFSDPWRAPAMRSCASLDLAPAFWPLAMTRGETGTAGYGINCEAVCIRYDDMKIRRVICSTNASTSYPREASAGRSAAASRTVSSAWPHR
jgi:hypothetical protein